MKFFVFITVLIGFLLPLTHSESLQAQVEQTESFSVESVDQDVLQESELDTLTQAYSDKWQGVPTGEDVSMVERVLGSNNLIFVVLTVSLIIWFVLLTFLIRLDKKVTRIENSTHQLNS